MDDGFHPMGRDPRSFGAGSMMSCFPTSERGHGSSVGMVPLYQDSFDSPRSQFYQRQSGGGDGNSQDIKPAIAEMILEEERVSSRYQASSLPALRLTILSQKLSNHAAFHC
jgi:hypothetical protein